MNNNTLIMALQEQRKKISERWNKAVEADDLRLIAQNGACRNDLDALIENLGFTVEEVINFVPLVPIASSQSLGMDNTVVVFAVEYESNMDTVYVVGTMSGGRLLGRTKRCRQLIDSSFERNGDAYFMYGGTRYYPKEFLRLCD